MEPVDRLGYGVLGFLKDVLDVVGSRLPGDFSCNLRHHHDTDVVAAQLPASVS